MNKKLIKSILSFIIIFLSVLVIIFFNELIEISTKKYTDHRLPHKSQILRLGPNDIGLIEYWMTFDYINHVFGLPEDYIKQELQISDPKYPRISIRKYARENKETESSAVEQIRNLVRVYFASQYKK